MADEKKNPETPPANEQLELNFPSPDEFDSYDEVDSDQGQSELPDDSFDENAVSDEEPESGCCV